MFAYKLCRKYSDGVYGPLYVGTEERWHTGEWIKTRPGQMLDGGKVKSKLGGLAYRPGLHLSEAPHAPHIGKKRNGKIVEMHDNEVWLLCEIEDEIDYTPMAKQYGVQKSGKYDCRKACLHTIPDGGFYWFNTNPHAFGNWLITSGMRIVKELSDAEQVEICRTQFGVINPITHRKVA